MNSEPSGQRLSAKLNVFQRSMIVISVLWVVSFGCWTRFLDLDRAQEAMTQSYDICSNVAKHDGSLAFDKCLSDSFSAYNLVLHGSWARVGFTAIVPVVLAWLAGALAFRVVRWILAGRSR